MGETADLTELFLSENIEQQMVEEDESVWQGRTNEGILISWHESLLSIEGNAPTLIICNEFFDALPVNHFEWSNVGWVETMVNVHETTDNTNDENKSQYHFKLQKSTTTPTFAAQVLNKQYKDAGVTPPLGAQIQLYTFFFLGFCVLCVCVCVFILFCDFFLFVRKKKHNTLKRLFLRAKKSFWR